MKTFRSTLLLLVVAVVMTCCTVDPGSDGVIDANDTLTLTFPGMSSIAATRAGTYPALDAEKALSTVSLYVFTDASGSPGTYVTKLPVTLDSPGADPETGTGGTVVLTSLANGSYHLVGVANFAGLDSHLTADMPINDFCDVVVSQFPATGNSFVMASSPVAFDYNKTMVPAPTVIRLTRLAARIDILNEASTATNPFVVTHARIVNAVDRSSLINRGTSLRIGTGGVADKNLGWQANTATDPTQMFATLYTFENDAKSGAADQTFIEVKGTYKGQQTEFAIPFGDKSIVRNTRYLVTIRKVAQTSIDFNVEVLDWNEGAVIGVNPSMPVVPAPFLTYIQPLNSSLANVSTFSNYEGFAVESDGASTDVKDVTKIIIPFWRYRFDFTIACVNDDIDVVIKGTDGITGSWIDASQSVINNVATLDGSLYKKVFRLVFAANDLPDEQGRSITIQFRNTNDPTDAVKEVTIEQLALPCPAARFSKANVAELNTFADDISETNINTADPGHTYMWGRNIPIDINKAYTVSNDSQIDFSSADDLSFFWDENTYMTTSMSLQLYVSASQAVGDTWKKQIGRAVAKGAPASYVGTNGGDPCPVGWHLPTRAEFETIANGYKGIGSDDLCRFDHTATNNYSMTTQFGPWNKSSRTDNKCQNDYVMYAIKAHNIYEGAMKTALKIEMLPKSENNPGNTNTYYVKVTSRHLGEKYSFTVPKDNIDNDAFWASNNENDKVVIFPAYGSGNNMGTGVYSAANTTGYYYSSEVARISTVPGPVTLRIGSPLDQTGASKRYRRSFSDNWSFSAQNPFFLRCIKNYDDAYEYDENGNFKTLPKTMTVSW